MSSERPLQPRPPITLTCRACDGEGSWNDGTDPCNQCDTAGIVLAPDQPTCDHCGGDGTEPWSDNDVSGAAPCVRCQGWGVIARG